MTSHPPTQPEDPLIGTNVGEYTVVEAIGEGGMGIVYRGLQPVIKKQVAIKVLKPLMAADDQQVKRLIAEAEAVNAIRHRGIVDIFSLGQLADGRPYIVMEYLDGEPLDGYLKRSPRLPLAEVLSLLLEICGPLDAAHRAGVVHRDLKPSNVFLCTQTDGSRYVKLLDFGLAKRLEVFGGSSEQSSQTLVSGTPDYMAPEQARGLAVSSRTDIYALGVMAWELLSGGVPFKGLSPMDVMVAHVSSPAPPLPEQASLPPALGELVARMLSKLPEERPPSIAEVRASLERLVTAPAPAPSAPPAVTPSAPRLAQPPRRFPWWWVALAALAGVTELLVWSSTRVRPSSALTAPASRPALAPSADASEEVDAGAPAAAGAPDAGSPDAGLADAGAEAPRPPPSLPPGAHTLLVRINRLEDRARASANFDPSAMPFLQSMRRRLKADESVAMRKRVAGELDRWERQYLR